MTDPWLPPPPAEPPRPAHEPTVALAVAIGVLLVAGVFSLFAKSLTGNVRGARDRSRAAAEQQAAAEAATDRALEAPADTATVSPGPDGTRVFSSPPVEDDQHGYSITLPRGWEARHIGVRDSDFVFSDAVLTKPGTPLAVVVDRIDPGYPAGSGDLADLLYERLTTGDPPVEITTEYRSRQVGDGETGWMYEGTMRGGQQRMKVVVFDHAGETFRVDFVGPEDGWPPLDKEFERILRSWRWG